MLDDMYYTDYISCDNLQCGIDDECIDFGDGCICMDTLTEPDINGLCAFPEVHIEDPFVEPSHGVIQFTEGMPLFDQHERVYQATQATTTEPTVDQSEVLLSPNVYLISGLVAVVLVALAMFAIIYVNFMKNRRRESRGLKRDPEAVPSKSLSPSQAPLLIHSVKPSDPCHQPVCMASLVQPTIYPCSIGNSKISNNDDGQ